MSFLRHEQIYQSDACAVRGWPTGLRPGDAHRLDESATGYSLASCTPALLASASPDPPMVNGLAGTVNHHVVRTGEFSVGGLRNFQLALTSGGVAAQATTHRAPALGTDSP